MKTISVRQITLLLLAFVPVTKVIIMPSYLTLVGEQQAWLSTLFSFIIEGAVLAALIAFARRVDKPFFEFLSDTVGKTAARAVYLLYALYYIVKSCTLIIEQRSLIEVVLYETTPTVLNFLPFFFVAGYTCMAGTKALGRVADISVWATVISFAIILSLSAFNVKFDAILPLLYDAFPRTALGTAQSALWFGECTYLLFFMGKIKWSRHASLKILSGYAIGAALVILFFVFYIGIFQSVAMRNVFAIARTGKYSISLSKIGRLDFLALFALAGVSLFALATPLVFATECICTVFPIKKRLYPAIGVTLLPMTATVFFGRYLQTFLTLNTHALNWFYWTMSAIIPLLICLLHAVLTKIRGKRSKRIC